MQLCSFDIPTPLPFANVPAPDPASLRPCRWQAAEEVWRLQVGVLLQ